MKEWLYKGIPLETPPEGSFGFVYLITNIISGRRYIGRKYFGSTRRVKVKNKTNRKVVRKESDWKEYASSSDELKADIEKLGESSFIFEILLIANTKGQVNYAEENLQHKFNVLSETLADGLPAWYNYAIGRRKFMSVKFPPNVKEQLHTYSINPL
jgi:hypothetical protein